MIALLILSLATQSLIPHGYMPSAAASGTWFEICPTGVSSANWAILQPEPRHSTPVAQHHGHHQHTVSHHHHGTNDDPESAAPSGHWQFGCPFGSVVADALAVEFALFAATTVVILHPASPTLGAATRFTPAYRSRAPPVPVFS